MAAQDLLQPKVETTPIIYAYSDTRYPDTLKVGFTTRPIEVRMHEHYPTVVPGQSWKVELVRPAMRKDGATFDDHAVHEVLRNSNIRCVAGESLSSHRQTDLMNSVQSAIFGTKVPQSSEKCIRCLQISVFFCTFVSCF